MIDNMLGEYVRKKRGEKSLREFAKICKLSHTHLDSIEKGYDPRTGKPVSPTIEALKKIAAGSGDSFGDFLIATGFIVNGFFQHNGDSNYVLQNPPKLVAENATNYDIPIDSYNIYTLPIYGEVTAGPGGYALHEFLGTEQWITTKNGDGENYFILRIKGDSMYPRYFPGDFVVVKLQNEVDTGDSAMVIIIDGEEGTLTRVKKVANGIILHSDNSLYPDREFFDEKTAAVKIIGKVVDIKPGRL